MNLKIALVHDYLNEFGGAERVLLALSEMYPEAPIYTAFYKDSSAAYERFSDRDIRPSWAQRVPGFSGKLHSPLRFLAPNIWESFNFDEFDVVISSASWYITKGIITRPETLHICYCHTPPRYLYGYKTSIEWQKYGVVRAYAKVVNKYLRQYDYLAAQRVDYFVANSKNVQKRIEKFYRRDSTVIYPPVSLSETRRAGPPGELLASDQQSERKDYFLVISRIVGGKGLQLAVEAANELKVSLKVVGVGAGWSREEERLKNMAGDTVELLGFVDDEELAELYARAKAFMVLAEDEDFGMTPVEAMMMGTPVVAYKGGGYLETVVDGETGVFFDKLNVESVVKAMKQIDEIEFDGEKIQLHAKKFSKERFVREMDEFVHKKWEHHHAEES